MYSTLTTLLDRLARVDPSTTPVIPWSSPIPAFGDVSTARVATLGLNPSNREFVDEQGAELRGTDRRFHTLESLALNSWVEADARHLSIIMESCQSYFESNPYDRWFRKLDEVLAGAYASFYDASGSACHLDLVPFATAEKWTVLSSMERGALLSVAGDTLGRLLRESQIQVLILNGTSVVRGFEQFSGVKLRSQEMAEWTLARQEGADVRGIAFMGNVATIASTTLDRQLLVLGYNHNIQSSFGVTNQAIDAIRSWVSRAYMEAQDAA